MPFVELMVSTSWRNVGERMTASRRRAETIGSGLRTRIMVSDRLALVWTVARTFASSAGPVMVTDWTKQARLLPGHLPSSTQTRRSVALMVATLFRKMGDGASACLTRKAIEELV